MTRTASGLELLGEGCRPSAESRAGNGERARTERGQDGPRPRGDFLDRLVRLLRLAQETAEGSAAASLAAALAAVERAGTAEAAGARYVETGPGGWGPRAHGAALPRPHRPGGDLLRNDPGEPARKGAEQGKEAARDRW